MINSIIVFLITLIIGIISGCITGLLPGLHVNTIAVFISSILPILLINISSKYIIIFIVSLAITHTFLDFIPSIFLGAPDSDTVLSILPGHKLLTRGEGYNAVIYSMQGGLIGLIIILLFIPLFIYLLPYIYSYLRNSFPIILILASIYLLILEKKSKFWAIIIFLLSGFLGLASSNLNQSLLPLLTGLFGSSSLITSMMKKEKIPLQKIGEVKQTIKKKIVNLEINKKISKIFLASSLTAPLCCLLPSLGTAQATVIGSEIMEDIKKKEFITMLGSINTIVAGLAFITLYSISETRTGAAVVLKDILEITSNNLLIIIITILISGLLASFLTIYLGKIIAKKINKINYYYLSLFILLFLVIITIIFSGFLGLLVFIVATFIGLSSILLGIRRTHLMGSLMIPTIIFYLL